MIASVIEKHFIIDKSRGAVDSGFSIEQEKFKKLVKNTKIASSYKKNPVIISRKSVSECHKNKRSLYIIKNIREGEAIKPNHILSKRSRNVIFPIYNNNLKRSYSLKYLR